MCSAHRGTAEPDGARVSTYAVIQIVEVALHPEPLRQCANARGNTSANIPKTRVSDHPKYWGLA
jgi:hypothetical protein